MHVSTFREKKLLTPAFLTLVSTVHWFYTNKRHEKMVDQHDRPPLDVIRSTEPVVGWHGSVVYKRGEQE